jgi:hypothetical protein
MEKKPSLETNSRSVQKFPAFNGTRIFITALTRARHWSIPRPCSTFCNRLVNYIVELLATRRTPTLEDHPLLAVHEYLFITFVATLRTWSPPPPSAIQDAPFCGDRDQHKQIKFPIFIFGTP